MQILLADDHDLVRDAIGSLLILEDESIGLSTAKDLNDALRVLHLKAKEKQSFDVIVLDLRMPGMDGLVGAQKMIDAAKGVPVIIMSGQASNSDVRAAHKIGVKGFVPKTLAGKSLLSAVRLVALGESYFPAEMLSPQESTRDGGLTLTEREAEVLSQLRQGNSNKEIAKALSIAETTVKLHMRSLSDKLGARNRTDIVIKAIDIGLV